MKSVKFSGRAGIILFAREQGWAGKDRQQAVLRGDIHAADPVLVWGAFPALCFLVQYNGQRDENRDQALISNWIGRLKITSRKFCKRLVHSSRMNRSGQELYQAPIFKLVTQNYFLIPLSALRFFRPENICGCASYPFTSRILSM